MSEMASNINGEDVIATDKQGEEIKIPVATEPHQPGVQPTTSTAANGHVEPLGAHSGNPAVNQVAEQKLPNIGSTSNADLLNDTIRVTPAATMAINSASRGRGRGGYRGGRGKSRSSLTGAKARKRKRSDHNGEDDSDDVSSDEVVTPTAVTTKSGRSVQRPTSFAPPANASPDGGIDGATADAGNGTARVYRKKRVWRRNAENAVCKSCLRGTSPASNMIVFCDGCNTPYHRWCHHPPISQAVIDEPDKEWYCRGCARERVVPVPESELAHWIAAPGATSEEKRQFFMSLTPGTMITLLMRATNAQSSLPVFAPEWVNKASSRALPSSNGTFVTVQQEMAPAKSEEKQTSLAREVPHQQQQASTIYVQHDDDDEDEGYGAEEHPSHYVRPGKGLMSTLPPDKDDEKYLVDEDSSRGVFHHVYLVDESSANQGVNATPP